MYDHILIPIATDQSEAAQQSLAIAKTLLADGGKITLINVIEDIPAFAEAYIPETSLADTEANATEMLQTAAKASSDVSTIAITHGKPGPAIVTYAQNHAVDLIVIASHKPGLEDYFIGSTAARVVRFAKCCVHVIR